MQQLDKNFEEYDCCYGFPNSANELPLPDSKETISPLILERFVFRRTRALTIQVYKALDNSNGSATFCLCRISFMAFNLERDHYNGVGVKLPFINGLGR